ncbi:hypothetical protein FSP39_015828 [Pinctada imbricata]|uniref:G-protein coupled receptors family 1 profile domain-containing protein n=1 Tax=Pinctada imbricata TaxID=66713 RepID=A0AA88XRE6_PINIB|nr:hypothetical protein FSP39_015828 [Pinctada imbricata]
MQNTTNILIVSLALADLLFITFCVPFTAVSYASTDDIFGNVWCKIASYMMYVCAYASVWTLVLMSFDRYLAVVHPIASMRIRNRRNTYILLLCVWIVIILGNIPLLVRFDTVKYTYIIQERSACFDVMAADDIRINQAFYSCFMTFGYVVPLTLICLLYGFLLKRLLYGVSPGRKSKSREYQIKEARDTNGDCCGSGICFLLDADPGDSPCPKFCTI